MGIKVRLGFRVRLGRGYIYIYICIRDLLHVHLPKLFQKAQSVIIALGEDSASRRKSVKL